MSEFEDIIISGESEDFSEENDGVTTESEELGLSNEEKTDFQEEFPKENDAAFEETEEYEAYEHDKRPKRKRKIAVIIVIAVIIAALAVVGAVVKAIKGNKDNGPKYKDVAVERRTISNTITGSSSIEPNDSYNVTTIKSGDIDADYFKEGDTVKKGDKLYQFDDSDAQKSLTSARNAVTKAEQSYNDALKAKSQTQKTNSNGMTSAQISLSEAQDTYNKQYVKTDISGKVKEVYVSKGDNVTAGAKIADVYNDSSMKLVLPFNSGGAENVYTGASAEISVAGTGGTVYGIVTKKSSGSAAQSSHASVVYVTIEIENPGALTEEDSGSAMVNGVACSDTAKFEYIGNRTIIAEVSGTVEELNVIAGDSVSGGAQIAYVKSTQAQNALKNAQLSVEKQTINSDTYSQDSQIKSAKLALDDAKLQLEKAQDAVDDYLIEAPIEGTVVTKNAKAGDTIDTSNSQTALCVIYDLSCVKLNIDVDETEVALVKTGQAVKVTADAVDGEFSGTVVKVPVDGVNENGVTTYTIEVEIKNYGELLPGMNVDAEITVEEAANVLAVPVNSVNRGDIVFVKDDGTKRANDVTDIINGAKDAGGEEESDGEKDNSKEAKQAGGDAQSTADGVRGKHGGEPAGGPSNMSEGAMPTGIPAVPGGLQNSQNKDISNIPMNIEIPEGYRAVKVETGINDTEYIEIKSGLSESDMVRALDTEASSANASFGEEDMMNQMQGMPGGMGGGMSGGMGGGMPGGGRSAGGSMPGGGMR